MKMRIRWISSQMESELPFVWLHTHDRLNTKQCAKCVCVWEHVANFDLIRWLFACIPHCLNKITMWSSSSNEQHLCNGQYISHRERARLTWNWIWKVIPSLLYIWTNKMYTWANCCLNFFSVNCFSIYIRSVLSIGRIAFVRRYIFSFSMYVNQMF